MANASAIRQYLNSGKRLTLLNGKTPIVMEWTTEVISDEQLYAHIGNIAWVLDSCDLVIDVDPQNGGDVSFAKLLDDFKADGLAFKLIPTVATPQGGYHIYLNILEEHQGRQYKRSLNKTYPGIEFLTQGSSCTIPTCTSPNGLYTWHDDLFGGFEQNPAPKAIIDLIAYDAAPVADLGDFNGLIGGSSSSVWTVEQVTAMLATLDPNMPNNDWVRVGMAIHDYDPSDIGLAMWDNWSEPGDNYKLGETAKRWRSFKPGGGVTFGTLDYMVKDVTYDAAVDHVDAFLKEIALADEKTLDRELMPKLAKQSFSDIGFEKITKAVQARFKELTGITMRIDTIRVKITNTAVERGTFISDSESPWWCKLWLYVNSHTGFANITTLHIHKAESFNIENGKYVPAKNGAKPSASKYVADRGYIQKVDTLAYLPMFDGLIYEYKGLRMLNSFNHSTVPTTALAYTPGGLATIQALKKHFKFICSTDEYTAILVQWLAHQVQYPGKIVGWSPLIQSIQGVGKTFFGEILRACLGDCNVGTVSPSQVVSDFNGWATGKTVNVLEELRVKGHNRHEVGNALKPLITDRIIQINDKRITQYDSYNTTGYLAFTNFKDSVPLEDDDRRWWVIFVPLQSLAHLKDFVGEDAVTYFPKMFDAIGKHGDEIRKWFLEYPISDEFLKIKQAPMTVYKASMIAMEEASVDGLVELKEVIEKGGQFFNKDAISSVDLFNQLQYDYPELDFKTTQRNFMLKRLGYMLMPSPVKLDGKTRRIWVKIPTSLENARRLLLTNSDTATDSQKGYKF